MSARCGTLVGKPRPVWGFTGVEGGGGGGGGAVMLCGLVCICVAVSSMTSTILSLVGVDVLTACVGLSLVAIALAGDDEAMLMSGETQHVGLNPKRSISFQMTRVQDSIIGFVRHGFG